MKGGEKCSNENVETPIPSGVPTQGRVHFRTPFGEINRKTAKTAGSCKRKVRSIERQEEENYDAQPQHQ